MKPARPMKKPEDVHATMLWPASGNERVRSSNAMLVAVALNETNTAPDEATASPRHAFADTVGLVAHPGSEKRPAGGGTATGVACVTATVWQQPGPNP